MFNGIPDKFHRIVFLSLFLLLVPIGLSAARLSLSSHWLDYLSFITEMLLFWVLFKCFSRMRHDKRNFEQIEQLQKETSDSLHLSKERFILAVEQGAQDGIWDWDLITNEVYYSPLWKSMLGYEEAEWANDFSTFIALFHPDDLPRVFRALEEYHAGAAPEYKIEARMLHKDGAYRWILARGASLWNEMGKPYRMAGSHIDITERKEMEQKIAAQVERLSLYSRDLEDSREQLQSQQAEMEQQQEEILQANSRLIAYSSELEIQKAELAHANALLHALALTDGLTGLYNHRAFQERIQEEYARASRSHLPLSLILVDVDKFKNYNDSFGHPAGDEVLKQVAVILQETARINDIVARYGGEEFVVILPETDADDSMIAAERLREAIQTASWANREITISLGAATLKPEMTAAEMISAADQSLYLSKQHGRNRSTHADEPRDSSELITSQSSPYHALFQELLIVHSGMLTEASQQVKETMLAAYDTTITSWANLLDMKEGKPEGHSHEIGQMMERLALNVGMNEEEALFARWGALLHDIGNVNLPNAVLHKTESLTEDDWTVIRSHPRAAVEMLSPIIFLRPALDIPAHHHEKWDGSGYPNGLKGDEIPVSARLFAVIDVYTALRSERPYRAAWSETKTIQYLREQSGSHFDPRAVKAFLKMKRARSRLAA